MTDQVFNGDGDPIVVGDMVEHNSGKFLPHKVLKVMAPHFLLLEFEVSKSSSYLDSRNYRHVPAVAPQEKT